MTSQAEEKKAQLIDWIATALEQRLPVALAPMAAAFARRYFAWAPPEDLLDDPAEDLYGAVLAHWNFARQRPPGAVALRIYNPDFEAHGWRSTHTVVEIVCDDRPFLVDSITLELNRHGLTVHRTLHPIVRTLRDAAVAAGGAATGQRCRLLRSRDAFRGGPAE